MNLTKIKQAIEQLEKEKEEKEKEKLWQAIKKELKISDLNEACCVNRLVG